MVKELVEVLVLVSVPLLVGLVVWVLVQQEEE